MNAIEVSSLYKTFTKKMTQKVHALRDVSFAAKEGEVLGFIGPNGAGKSTSIKIVMGLLKPDSGNTLIFGKPSADPSARQRIGFLAENPAYYDFLTPRELLGLVGKYYAMSDTSLRSSVANVLKTVELEHAADRPIRGLSKGMVQRIGLGQALVHDPELFILDEPMSGLDPLGRDLVKEIILGLKKRGKTVFFSTHIIHDVERICDKAIILIDGEVRFSGMINDVIDESFTHYEVVMRGLIQEETALVEEGITVVHESDHSKVMLPKQSLANLIPHLAGKGEILSVEPHRRTLEQLFLELVKGKGGR